VSLDELCNWYERETASMKAKYDAVVKERDEARQNLQDAIRFRDHWYDEWLKDQNVKEMLKAERDALKVECAEAHAAARNNSNRLMSATQENAALKATVERVKALSNEWWKTGGKAVANSIAAALAPQGEGKAKDWKPCCLSYPHHVHCCHPERRGTTGFDGRGRRHDDDETLWARGKYADWDRRSNRTRRGGGGK
jgi:hypothetical protein